MKAHKKSTNETIHCNIRIFSENKRIQDSLSTWRVKKIPRVITVKPVKATTDILLSPAFLYKKAHNTKKTETISATLKTPFFTFQRERKRERDQENDENRRSPSYSSSVYHTSDESNRRIIHRSIIHQETSQHFTQRRHRRSRLSFFLRLFLRGNLLLRRPRLPIHRHGGAAETVEDDGDWYDFREEKRTRVVLCSTRPSLR